METYEPTPQPIIEWLGFCTTHKGLGGETIAAYRAQINKFYTWLVRHKRIEDLWAVKTQDIRDFCQHLELEDKRSATIALSMSVVNNFYQWAEYEGRIDLAPMPKSILVKGQEKLPRLVPPPQAILTIRGRRGKGVNIEKAATFETLVSTGMRIGELTQVRACDIDFDEIPFDHLTGAPCRFAGGSITLDKKVHRLKSLGRTVPISIIAARMLLRYMDRYGIKQGSNIPLFPRRRQEIEKHLAYLGHGIVTLDSSSTSAFGETREPGFQDIDTESLDIDPELRKRIEKQKRVWQEKDPLEKKADRKRMEKPYVRRLHPHALRHAFAAFMFYRTYHGDRGSLQRIAYYMGHAAPTTSMIYLSKLNLIDSERTWERLWLGRGSDWNQAIGAR